tara:strand:+ start:363 stop:1118 length:756 start_codon:yes stop_codon:yes gene_type:complete
MAAYTPASLYWGQPFEASVVDGNFKKLSDVLNSQVGDYASLESNVRNDRASLDFSSFRRNSLTESFRSPDLRTGSASGDEVFVVSIEGATASTTPWGIWKNDCDSVGTGLRFYLRDSADVQFASQINLVRMKTNHAFGAATLGRITEAVLQVTAKLMIDGVAEKTIERDIYMSTAGVHPYSDALNNRGLSICFNHIEEGMGIGPHTAHVNLTFNLDISQVVGGAGTAALSDYSIIQIKGSGGTTCATAFYK